MDDSYLRLNDATDGVGTFPQHQRMSVGYDTEAETSVTKLPLYAPASTTPNLDALELERGAKLTDWISSVQIIAGMVISARLSELFATFNLAPHSLYPAVVHHRGSALTDAYRVLHMPHLSFLDGNPTPAEASAAIAAHSPGLDLFVLHRPTRLRGIYASPRLASALREGGFTGIRIGRGKLRAG